MEQDKKITGPDNTAVRTALWRALHVQVDAKPYVFEDEIGLKLISLQNDSQIRQDTKFAQRFRASIVARARFIEDLIIEQSRQGIIQYVILGAGLDTFAQRRPDIASKLQIYEIDQPETLTWKQQRLIELNFGVPEYLHFVPVNFETSSWKEQLIKAGFDTSKPAVVACTGVTVYLTKNAITSTLKQISTLATGSILAITFYLPLEFLDEEDQFLRLFGVTGARDAGTPFVSFFEPNEILALAWEAGLKEAKIISTKEMDYFRSRADNLLPASGEVFLLATT
jgi:methyltransferase (TIGR00027 family)